MAGMLCWMRAHPAEVAGYWLFGESGTALMLVYQGPMPPPTMSLR
jgi:hypothetical protein